LQGFKQCILLRIPQELNFQTKKITKSLRKLGIMHQKPLKNEETSPLCLEALSFYLKIQLMQKQLLCVCVCVCVKADKFSWRGRRDTCS